MPLMSRLSAGFPLPPAFDVFSRFGSADDGMPLFCGFLENRFRARTTHRLTSRSKAAFKAGKRFGSFSI
jgi:hypothetical protein